MKENISQERKDLINRLGYIRNRAKLSARELSQRIDQSCAYIAKFDNGDFNIPSERLLDAIQVCGSTPEEFFFRNISEYQEYKEIIDLYEGLSPESRTSIREIMKNLK